MKKRITKEQKFWNWFISQKHLFENVLVDQKQASQRKTGELMDLFESKLHKYDKNLWFRMGGGMNPFELIITAEGNRKAFSSVQKLVNSVPQFDNWKIIAFIQSADISNIQYRSGNYMLTAGDIFFSFAEKNNVDKGHCMEVMFYVVDEKHIDNIGFKSSIVRIAETSVGEYDFANIVRSLNVVKISEFYNEHKSGLIPIARFAETVNDIKAKIAELT